MTRRIAIIGGGPAGLTAALVGQRLGLHVTVLERARNFKRIGGGVVLQSNGHRVLETLGLLQEFLPLTFPCHGATIETEDARRLVTADYRSVRIPHPVASVVMRYDLQEFLLRAALTAGIPVRLGWECTEVTIAEDCVRVRGGGQLEPFDLVVAADGLHSAVRRSLGLRERIRTSGEGALRGVARIACRREEIVEIWGRDGRRFGYAPLPGERTYFYATIPTTDWSRIIREDIERFCASWSDSRSDVRAILAAVEDWNEVNYDELKEVRLRPWHVGPVFLIGDAAHAMTPNVGQGANSAMVDALILMQLIAKGVAAGDLDSVGPTFDRVRRLFVTKIQATAWRWGRMARWSHPAARTLRNGMMRAMGRMTPILRDSLAMTAGYNPVEDRYFTIGVG